MIATLNSDPTATNNTHDTGQILSRCSRFASMNETQDYFDKSQMF